MYSRLQYISQGISASDQLANIASALEAGTNWIQLRFKSASSELELLDVAVKARAMCNEYSATFIVNDHPHIAKKVFADGVHLGLKDMRVEECRKIVGDIIIGGTANTFVDILQRVDEGCNYIGVGPYRYTTTKENLSPVIGLEGYKVIMDSCKASNVAIPIYAVGGIQFDDITELIQAGVYGIAASGLITNHPDKKGLLQNINALLT